MCQINRHFSQTIIHTEFNLPLVTIIIQCDRCTNSAIILKLLHVMCV